MIWLWRKDLWLIVFPELYHLCVAWANFSLFSSLWAKYFYSFCSCPICLIIWFCQRIIFLIAYKVVFRIFFFFKSRWLWYWPTSAWESFTLTFLLDVMPILIWTKVLIRYYYSVFFCPSKFLLLGNHHWIHVTIFILTQTGNLLFLVSPKSSSL